MFKKLLFILSVISIVACSSKPRVNLDDTQPGLKPTAQHQIIAKEVATLLQKSSYKKVQMNDSISNIIFNNLIKSIDQGKNYLLASDIKEFEQYRNTVAQDFAKGDLSSSFHIFNIYSQRYLERMNYALAQIDAKHNFTIDESFIPNREKLAWFKTQAEADDQWRLRAKYDLLNQKQLSTEEDNSEEKQKERLRNRYKNLISQAKKTNANDAFQIVMTALTDAVDPHTSYFNPSFAQAFNEGMSNTFEGIGARLTIDNEVVKIAEIIAGGPIFKDKSMAINDKIIAVAQGKDGEFEDIIGWRLDAAVAKIKGPKGTVVRLKVIPAGQELNASPKIISLKRERIVVAEESAKKEVKTVKGEDGKDYKIGIIALPKFYMDFEAYRKRDPNYKSTTRDVKLLLDTLKNIDKVDAVVMDLRFNGGGSLPEAIDLTGLFIDKGPVVQVRDIDNRVEIQSDRNAGLAWDGPLGVIINRFSASASEIFAGAIQDYGRGIILGSQSYGKGTVQSAVDMGRFISKTDQLLLKAVGEKDADTPSGAPEFGQINITLAKFYRVNGSSTQHKGVSADVDFPTQYSAESYGESSEPSALPWDQINSTNFIKITDLSTTNKQLNQIHQNRMKKSLEYKYLLDDIKTFAEKDSLTKVSVQQTKFEKEREENQSKNRDRVNALLKLKGQALWEKGKPQPKLDFDFVRDESLNVMADYIRIYNKK